MIQHALAEVEPDSRDILLSARVILAAASDPHTNLSISGIAERTGLTYEAVKQVLNSPVYQRILEDQFKLLVTGVMTRGLTVMDSIIHKEKGRDADKVAAFRAVTATYTALVGAIPKHDEGNAQQDMAKALAMLDSIRSSRTITASP